MYKPNFCSDCGTEIERSRWRLWTSRQFCAECSPRLRKTRLAPLGMMAATVFVMGIVTGRVTQRTTPTLVIERKGNVSADLGHPPEEGKGNSSTSRSSVSGETNGPDGTNTERPTDPEETISICGARTQKGSPCQRRVRGTGRCWQHKGAPAMLPPGKLVVQS